MTRTSVEINKELYDDCLELFPKYWSNALFSVQTIKLDVSEIRYHLYRDIVQDANNHIKLLTDIAEQNNTSTLTLITHALVWSLTIINLILHGQFGDSMTAMYVFHIASLFLITSRLQYDRTQNKLLKLRTRYADQLVDRLTRI